MPKTKVKLSMFADPVEVDEEEIPGLRSQGLLIEEPADAAPAPAVVKAAAKPKES